MSVCQTLSPAKHDDIEFVKQSQSYFTSDTDVLTEKGWMNCYKVSQRFDKLASFNTTTNTIEFQPILSYQLKSCRDDLVEFDTLAVSTSHEILHMENGWKKENVLDCSSRVSIATCGSIGVQKELTDRDKSIIRLLAWVVVRGMSKYNHHNSDGDGMYKYSKCNVTENEYESLLPDINLLGFRHEYTKSDNVLNMKYHNTDISFYKSSIAIPLEINSLSLMVDSVIEASNVKDGKFLVENYSQAERFLMYSALIDRPFSCTGIRKSNKNRYSYEMSPIEKFRPIEMKFSFRNYRAFHFETGNGNLIVKRQGKIYIT